MTAYPGYEFLLKRGSTLVAGCRTKSLTFNGEAVDITSDDDEGVRTLLDKPGMRSIDISVDGITKNEEWLAAMSDNDNYTDTYTMEFKTGGTITGKFFHASVEMGGAHNEGVTFSASLQSSGDWTYTPPS